MRSPKTGNIVPVAGTLKAGVDRRAMGALSAGHLFTDVNQGAVAALIPFLVSERGISLAAAGALVLASTFSSSVIQPLFGIFSDKRPLPHLMPVGVLLAGLGIALTGVAPGYAAIFACVVLSGIGVAAFHPEGARFANYVSGARRARGMSFFSVGGNAGFAIGPVLTTPLVLLFGLPGTLFLFLPAAVMAGILLFELPRMMTFRPQMNGRQDGSRGDLPERWGSFALVTGVVAVRSFVYFGLVSFVAAYYVRVLGTSEAIGNAALTVMLASGAVGTLLMGTLADRFGRRAVMRVSMLLLPPLVLLFTLSGPLVGTALLALVGALIIGTFGVTVVMGQEYLPGRIGLAAGVTIGFSVGLGGLGAPVLGLIADAYGLPEMMLVVAALPVAGLLLALALPARSLR